MIHSSQASNVKTNYHKPHSSTYSRRSTVSSVNRSNHGCRGNSINSSLIDGNIQFDDHGRSQNANKKASCFTYNGLKRQLTKSILNAIRNINQSEGKMIFFNALYIFIKKNLK